MSLRVGGGRGKGGEYPRPRALEEEGNEHPDPKKQDENHKNSQAIFSLKFVKLSRIKKG